MPLDRETLITLTADIVATHANNNTVAQGDLPLAIAAVYDALAGLGAAPAPVTPEKPRGAVSVRASIKPDYLVSMIDGKHYRTLRRHLTTHGHTPESYRNTFGLPKDYPMVCASYAEQRRALAIKIGLGRKPGTKAPRKKRPTK